jgi:hypothetical protein
MEQLTQYIEIAAHVAKLVASLLVIWQALRKRARKRP